MDEAKLLIAPNAGSNDKGPAGENPADQSLYKGGDMKAIKDCEWEIKIDMEVSGFYTWSGSLRTIYVAQRQLYNTEQSAKRNWERFAKLNKIKKWKYI